MESQRGINAPPIQKLSIKYKGEEWRKQNVDYYISKYDTTFTYGASKKDKMKISYDLYNSIFDESDFKYITDPYKVNDGFPASIQNFNIIKPKIDLLIGEETKRPYSYRIIQVNEEAVTKLQQKYKQLLTSAIAEIAAKGGPEDPVSDEDMQQIEDISKYMDHDYVDIAETIAYHSLEYLNEKEDIRSKFVHGFKDGLISGMEVHYVGILNGEPVLERVNPMYFSFDNSPEVQFIEDGDFGVRLLKMSLASIYDRLYDIMDESTLDKLLATYGSNTHGTSSSEFNRITWKNFDTRSTNDEFDSEYIDVYHVTWKSFIKVGFITYFDEDGEEQKDVVSEDYEPIEGEDIYWDWVTEIWEGYRIGNDLYVGIAPIQNQQISIDNPNSQKLPYYGAVYNNDNTKSKSLVEIMKPLQYMYLIIWYRLELALARDKGKILNMDVTQIPKSMGVDINKWLHYLTSMGVNFINPYEEGWDIPGREGGKAASFNQVASVDLTMSRVIADYIGLMSKIEEMIGELSGVSRQRQGQVNTSELVGNVERAVMQSAHITEVHFWIHNRIKKRVLEALLEATKQAWTESGKKKLHYITDDMTRIFLDISDDFLYSDFGIFASDSTMEAKNLEAVRNLLQPAMQNGASLTDVTEIVVSNNLTEIRKKLKEIDKNKQKREEQMVKLQNESQQQISEMEMQLRSEELRIKEEGEIRKSDTDIRVALIKTGMEEEKLIAQGNKISADIDKNVADNDYKYEELKEQIRSNKADEAIKARQVQVQASKPTTTKK